MTNGSPILAVTLGDPAGIGPEIAALTLADPPTEPSAQGLAVGDARILRRAVADRRLDVDVHPVSVVGDAAFESGTIDIVDTGTLDHDPAYGEVDADAGRAAIAAIERAARLALDGEVAAVVTAPINKEAIWAAGSEHLGHTEMLGELTGAQRPETMFVVRGLKIFFTTRHLSLREALDQISTATVRDAIDHACTALGVLGHDRPTLAVAALNPHGGEGGSFGREEIDAIAPACDAARADGRDVVGPVPADAVFHQGVQGRYDAVLCHFHDQGHIAAKTLDFDGAVSVTMGLPIIRSSVDHGTAFDIAGTGAASAETMKAAYAAGARFAPYAEQALATYGDTSNRQPSHGNGDHA